MKFAIIEDRTWALDLILWGLYIYYIGIMMFDYIFPMATWTRIISALGVLLIIRGSLKVEGSMFGLDNVICKFFVVFIGVCLLNCLLGIPSMIIEGRAREFLVSKQILWTYLIGLVFLIHIGRVEMRRIFQFAIIYGVTCLVFSLFNFAELFLYPERVYQDLANMGNAYSLEMGKVVDRAQEPGLLITPLCCFAIYFSNYSNKVKLLLIAGVTLGILAALLTGRRSAFVQLLAYVMIPIVVKFISSKNKVEYVFAMISLIIVVSLFLADNLSSFFFEDYFTLLSDRIGTDTRGPVEADYYKDMKSPADWIFGRGMAGTYKCPAQAMVEPINRPVIETGYLNLILHGGLLLLIPYVLLLSYAFFLGFFKSRSNFVKCCSLCVLLRLFLLYPGGHLQLTFICFILFVQIRICSSRSWRLMSDRGIRKILFR